MNLTFDEILDTISYNDKKLKNFNINVGNSWLLGVGLTLESLDGSPISGKDLDIEKIEVFEIPQINS